MCWTDLEQPSVFRQSQPRARKARRCVECGAAIPVGEAYLYTFGVWDGVQESFGMHLACAGLRKLAAWALCGNEGEIPFGFLADEISEYGDGGEPFREVLDAIRQKYGSLSA